MLLGDILCEPYSISVFSAVRNTISYGNMRVLLLNDSLILAVLSVRKTKELHFNKGYIKPPASPGKKGGKDGRLSDRLNMISLIGTIRFLLRIFFSTDLK